MPGERHFAAACSRVPYLRAKIDKEAFLTQSLHNPDHASRFDLCVCGKRVILQSRPLLYICKRCRKSTKLLTVSLELPLALTICIIEQTLVTKSSYLNESILGRAGEPFPSGISMQWLPRERCHPLLVGSQGLTLLLPFRGVPQTNFTLPVRRCETLPCVTNTRADQKYASDYRGPCNRQGHAEHVPRLQVAT